MGKGEDGYRMLTNAMRRTDELTVTNTNDGQ